VKILTEKQVHASRAILAEYGNMSLPTVWFVLQRILEDDIAPGDWIIMVAFGAGLSAHAFLLRAGDDLESWKRDEKNPFANKWRGNTICSPFGKGGRRGILRDRIFAYS